MTDWAYWTHGATRLGCPSSSCDEFVSDRAVERRQTAIAIAIAGRSGEGGR